MSAAIPNSGASLILFLQQNCGLSIERTRTFPLFGDKIVQLRGQNLVVRILKDRGSWFVEIRAIGGPDQWYDMAILKEHIADRIGNDVLSFDEQADFLKNNWKIVDQLFVGPNANEVHADLKRRRQERVNRRFPTVKR